MNKYEVLDYNFDHVGFIEALTPDAALVAAKVKWKFVIGLMVEEYVARH